MGKSGDNKIESKLFALKSSLVGNSASQLVWASKDTFILTAINSKSLYVLRRPPGNEIELILMKSTGGAGAFDVIKRDAGDLLVYADDVSSNKKLLVHTIDLKSMQERADLSFGIVAENSDDQRLVIHVSLTVFFFWFFVLGPIGSNL